MKPPPPPRNFHNLLCSNQYELQFHVGKIIVKLLFTTEMTNGLWFVNFYYCEKVIEALVGAKLHYCHYYHPVQKLVSYTFLR